MPWAVSVTIKLYVNDVDSCSIFSFFFSLFTRIVAPKWWVSRLMLTNGSTLQMPKGICLVKHFRIVDLMFRSVPVFGFQCEKHGHAHRHKHVCIYIYVYVYTYIYIYMYTHIFMYMYTHIYVYIHTSICLSICMYRYPDSYTW